MASQALEPNRKNLFILAGFVLLVLLVVLWEWAGSSNHGADSGGPTQAYFSDDDGATYFSGPADQSVPFTKGGKTVNRAHVFKCNGKLVVGYLSRYTQAHIDAVQHLEELKKNPKGGSPSLAELHFDAMGAAGTEVKAPGGKQWVNGADLAAASPITMFKCPDGSDPGDEVYP
jgi:hypothetical protein